MAIATILIDDSNVADSIFVFESFLTSRLMMFREQFWWQFKVLFGNISTYSWNRSNAIAGVVSLHSASILLMHINIFPEFDSIMLSFWLFLAKSVLESASHPSMLRMDAASHASAGGARVREVRAWRYRHHHCIVKHHESRFLDHLEMMLLILLVTAFMYSDFWHLHTLPCKSWSFSKVIISDVFFLWFPVISCEESASHPLSLCKKECPKFGTSFCESAQVTTVAPRRALVREESASHSCQLSYCWEDS